jgi:hypothetical protein
MRAAIRAIHLNMNGTWGRTDGAPPDAYSRVTNPERFVPLHDEAAKLLGQLEAEYDVERAEGYGLDPRLERIYKLARASVALRPRDAAAAPLVVAFSAFPGLHVRCGRWATTAFPNCGCDACAETLEGEVERLKSLIDDLTGGRFREGIRVAANGDEWTEWEFWRTGKHSMRHSSRLDPALARELIAGHEPPQEWGPWPRGSSGSDFHV